jgi:hypothetical protein
MLKIITDGYPKTNEVFLEEVICKYIQEPDNTEDRDGDPQELILSTRDGGGGKYIHIETTGWSISDIDDLEVVINDFKKRFNDIT